MYNLKIYNWLNNYDLYGDSSFDLVLELLKRKIFYLTIYLVRIIIEVHYSNIELVFN